MKKYFLVLISIFSFFFLCTVSDVAKAVENPMTFEVKLADQYDNRIVDIVVSRYDGYARSLKITELAVCSEEELDSCQKYERAKNDTVDHTNTFMKVVGEELITAIPAGTAGADVTINYVFQTASDGDIFLLVQCLDGSGSLSTGTNVYAYGVYKLSTLNQRIVINEDDDGKPTYSYDNIQYTAARNNRVNIELFPDEYATYTGEVFICEYYQEKNNRCVKYTISDDTINYYIESYGDGDKTIRFYLVKLGNIIAGDNFTDTNSTLITKNIILDTVGPKITLKGGQWVFVPSGSKYSAQTGTCKDETFGEDPCQVSNDLDIVRIDYTNSKYQLITYSATDRLGNTSSVVVKVKVEIIITDNSTTIALLVSALVLAATFTILGVIVYKNHLKKKKLSYI